MSDLPLTSAQLGLFFAHELAPDNPCYTTAEVVELAGPVDADVLREAHRRAYAEHEQVRVELAVAPDGPRQRVTELIEGQVPEVALPVVDVAGEQAAEAWLRDDLAVPMRLTGGDPLVRSALLRLPDGRCWWYHAAHHLVADGYAAQQLLRRIAEHHDAIVEQRAPRAEPGAVLADVVAEDAARDDTAATSAWQERLAGMTGVVALAGRTSSPAARARRAVVPLDEEAQTALVQGARRLGVGWTDLVTAAVGAYLARMAGRDATRIGLPLMNRAVPGVGQLAAARTVCTATNVLPLTIPGRGTVADVLAAVAAGQREVREHPFVRQEALQRMLAREHPGAQLFGAQLNLIPFDLEISLGEVAGAVRNLTAGPVEDMTIGLRGTPGRGRAVRLELDAHPDLYDAGELAAHLARLRSWLVALAGAEPDLPVEALPLATPDELRMIDGFNATAHPHDAATLAQRFVRQAEATPEAPALVFAGATRTYGELLDRSRRIAGGLRERGVGPGDVVGVRLPRGLGLYETIHAVQLLGAVYLPLDPDLPEARLAAMCEDADVALVVTDPARPAPPMTRAGGVADARRAPSMPSRRGLNEVAFAITRPGRRGTGQAFPLEELAAAEPVADVFADPAAPAYLLFTSGSTGRPKGVLVGHAAIDNRLAWMQHYFRLAPGERVLHKTPISFDVSVWELFWPLQAGGCVVIAEPGAHRDPRRLAELVVEERVTTLHFVPSMLRAFLADRVSRERVRSGVVRSLVCSGEALTPDLVAGCVEWFGVAPTNLYGPTEAAVDVTVWDCSPDDERAVPIGRPVWNTTCHVLDPGGRPVPIGVVGELWLGGVQLAEGYVGRPDLTAERFVDVPGLGRLYRTGDLAAWRPDGALRYLGRTDDQVKVRGQRIELGEIEAAVAGTDGADAVAAGVVDGRLVVWFVPAPGVGADEVVGGLRARAASALPEGWMPSHYVPVAAMPLGTSGKTDRARLAELAPPDTGAAAGAEAPSTLVEQQLCAIFGEVLGGSPLAPDADFFSSGGDSLGVLRLLGRVEDDLGVELGLADVFAAPTPAGLAALVSGGSAGGGGLDEVLTLRAARDSDRAPLFLLPPAGGLGWCYTSLLGALPADLPVHALQAAGLATGTPTAFDDLEALARHQLAAIRAVVGTGRFHVAGWSLGGMAAHAVAALARADDQDVGAVLLLDAYPSEQWQHLAEPTEQEALRGILRMGGVEGLLPDDADGAPVLDRAIVVDVLRAGGSALAALPPDVLAGCIAGVVNAARIVRSSRHPILDGDVDVVVATAPRAEIWLEATGWSSYTKGEVRRHDVAATHGDLVRRPAVDRVADVLAALLD
ncbi:amino acid adenylation domain-containing protein [Nocardioides humi]|uniref:amino acid adenylation domain-containing protein n=1 Tax=Nocardioides humi TaxID=449461 RepID=UPI0031DFC4ED